jgi:hypothetical protein
MYFALETLIKLFFFLFFSISIVGYGFLLKDRILKINFNFGEIGILGFFFLYIIANVLNFFVPIHIYLSLGILFIGFVLFINNHKKVIISKKLLACIIFLLLFISSLTVNLHDDALLYQLPYVKYKQEFKIIFGLVYLNDFLAYSHGLYDTMALFKVPFFENRLIFTIPVIFFMFFILSMIEYLDKKENITYTLIIFITFLILFKFTRSKEFGTDIPVIALLFLVQIYLLKFLFKKEDEYFYKILVMFTLAVLYKLYAALAIFYFLIFIFKLKKYFYDLVTNKRLIFIFLIFVSFVTFSKNIIQSGCLNFPITFTCIDKQELKWSAGKEISEWRNEVLKAGVKGWMPYVRENQYKDKIFPKQFNEQYKYNFHKYVFKDPDSEKILIILLIYLVVISLNFFSVEKIFKIKKPAQFTLFILCSLIPAILWFWLMPYTRYGGYAYLSFSLIILYYSLTFKPYHLFKIANFILIFGIIYFLSKNILRINNELESNNNLDTAKLLLIKNLGNYQFKTKQINNEKKIYISSHNWWCGNVPIPCLPGFWENMNIKINEKYGYQIISVNQKEYLDFQIKKMNIYNLSKDRYNLDYNEEIRVKK